MMSEVFESAVFSTGLMPFGQPRPWPRVVGLYAPKPQSGKSTVTAYIRHLLSAEGQPVVHLKLAGPLKDPLYKMGLTELHVEGDGKETPLSILGERSPRQFMIDLYKERAAADGPDWLATYARQRIDAALARGAVVVIDDVRTAADYRMLRSYDDAEVWRIDRPNVVLAGGTDNIEGMLERHNFDRYIQNNSTLEILRLRVSDALGVTL